MGWPIETRQDARDGAAPPMTGERSATFGHADVVGIVDQTRSRTPWGTVPGILDRCRTSDGPLKDLIAWRCWLPADSPREDGTQIQRRRHDHRLDGRSVPIQEEAGKTVADVG